MKYFMTALGLALVIEGIPYFLFPGGLKQVLAAMQELPEHLLRLFGLVIMLAGLGILYAVRSGH
ncbi:MAG: DUF2065 domain-containing protein [Deltaproteobacteria bacterium]|nr:MAG: DUF2065 domain-containing protein [Deltaproteobacteria bacterium]